MIKLGSRTRKNNSAGFTLTELIVVLVVVAIIAAVAIPSMIGFIRHGQHINRMNIARTLYLSMQNQLSRAVIEGNLRLALTEDFYINGTNESISEYLAADALGSDFPAADTVNRESVYYINKPAGYTPGGAGSSSVIDKFYTLLNEIIVNKEILDDAILMEFNIRTGVVMSIFYGDAGGLWFQPGTGADINRYFVYGAGGNNDVTGGRGMEGSAASPYEHAFDRRQGYFGVETTGSPADIQLDDRVDIFDGAIKALDGRENVLFAELLIPVNIDTQEYSFELVAENRSSIGFTPVSIKLPGTNNIMSLNEAVGQYNRPLDGELVYYAGTPTEPVEQHGILVTDSYDLFIWVLDFIAGDLTVPAHLEDISINRYGVFAIRKPLFIRAKITRQDGVFAGASSVSLRSDHSHYGGELRGNYELKSARHLNNIRYLPEGSFRQTRTIDLLADKLSEGLTIPGPVTNFAPIRNFTGGYDVTNDTTALTDDIPSRIMNLNINVTGEDNAGLFAQTSGTISGLSLFGATITSADGANVGAIAGEMTGGNISRSNSYADVAGGAGNTGGLIGQLSGGTLSHCFNAGFYNTHPAGGTLTVNGIGSVMANSGNIGGLVGLNNGTVQFSYNNARVNIDDVELTDDGLMLSINPVSGSIASPAALGGIAGRNMDSGVINRSYATNYVAIYENGIFSGGIAGFAVNNGAGISAESRYITNGCSDFGNDTGANSRAISKLDLMEEDFGRLPASLLVSFKSKAEYVNAYLAENTAPKNVYEKYPYPVLSNNMPYLDSPEAWGWEDIEDEADIPEARLVYYEFYDTGTVGFQNNIDKNAIGLVASNSDLLVIHDGYAIEFLPYPDGYKLRIGDVDIRITSEDEEIWTVEYENETDYPDPLGWLRAQSFISVTDGEDVIWYRLYIPNYFAEKLAKDNDDSNNIAFLLYANAGTDPDDTTEEPLNPPEIREYDPLFAPPAQVLIRSPRHIENIREALTDSYIQQLNTDFYIYRRELRLTGTTYEIDPETRLVYSAAVITNTFTGRYNGNNGIARWIANLEITGTSNSTGLFERNSGVISNVTLRDPNVSGGTNVGALAGTNTGRITNCSVQHAVSQAGAPPPYLSARPIVSGGTNVGVVVGNNTGTLINVAVVSTSGTPAVQGTVNVGGIAGTVSNTSSVDYIMYLAVAPMTGPSNEFIHPYVGSGYENIGSNHYYLSGTNAIRPFQVSPLPGIIGQNYNISTGQPFGMKKTLDMVRQFNNNGAWSVQTLTDAAITSQTNATFPYHYPTGTAVPVAFDWPLVDSLNLTPRDAFVYYEKYADGTTGVFTRRLVDPADSNSGYIELDFLNPYGAIVEAGYAIYLDPNRVAGNFQMSRAFSSTNYNTWHRVNINDAQGQNYNERSGTPIHPDNPQYKQLFPITYSWININIFNHAQNTDPTAPVAIAVAGGNGNNGVVAGIYLVNPLFAKECWPVGFNSTGSNISAPVFHRPSALPDTYSIRTPWQQQQISKVTQRNMTAGRTFIQEGNLDFSSVRLTSSVQLQNATGNATTPTPANTAVNYTATFERNNGTTAVVNNTAGTIGTGAAAVPPTANIITGSFAGTYNGNGRVISNLQLTSTATGNKGLFNTIGTGGSVHNFTMENCMIQNGENNGGFVSTNNGAIESVSYISTSATAAVSAVTVANAGGIVWTNNGTISNALYLARAPGDGTVTVSPISAAGGGTVSNSYYLSGTVSSNNRPSVEAAVNNYNTGSAVGGGLPRTTQELHAFTGLGLSTAWRAPLMQNIAANTLTSTRNPNPYLGAAPTQAWPVATIRASELAYYEIYSTDGGATTIGFYPAQDGNTLSDEHTVIEYGYCSIVPRAGGYSMKAGVNGQNVHLQARTRDGVNYVVIPASVVTGNETVEIYVNDLQIEDSYRYVNTMFAKGIYQTSAQINQPTQQLYIRMPQHMRNVTTYANAERVFVQERDLDFTGFTGANLNATGSVVSGVFNGTYDGGGYMISGLTINYTTRTLDNAGLFAENQGVIEKLTVFFDGDAQIAGNTYVGTIAGSNVSPGEIRDIAVVSSKVNTAGNAVTHLRGDNVAGIAGRNSGTIENVIYIAPAPIVDGVRCPIVCINSINTVSGTIVEAHFLHGADTVPAAIIRPEGSVVTSIGNGYNLPPINFGNGGSTSDLGALGSWTNWAPPGSDPLTYPYPTLNKAPSPPPLPSVPPAWPAVGEDFIPFRAPIEFASTDTDIIDMEADDVKSNVKESGNKEAGESGDGENGEEVEEPYETGKPGPLDGLMITAGAITLYGGYSFLRVQPLRTFIRRSNARAIRRINDHNDRKRRKL